MDGDGRPYSQAEHDEATELGGIGAVAAVALVVAVILMGAML